MKTCIAIILVSFLDNACNAFTIGSVKTPFVSKGCILSFSTQSNKINTKSTTITTKLYSTSSTTVKDITTSSEEKMVKTIDTVKTNLLSIRTGRASASILDRVRVEYYGALTPLNQLASISVPSAQQLQIDPYDKSIINAIERSIVDSDIGLSPSGSDGSIIRINIPPLTEDRRKEMIKLCKSIGEEGKVAIRNIRRDGVDNIKKLEKSSGTVGEDEMKDGLDIMQKLTDKKVKDIDYIISKKEKDVMTV